MLFLKPFVSPYVLFRFHVFRLFALLFFGILFPESDNESYFHALSIFRRAL